MSIRKLAAAIAVAAGLVAAAAGAAAATVGQSAAPASTTAAVHHATAATATQPKDGPEQNGEESTAESDGPGGHQDPAGQNVDHQFDGTE